MMMNLQRMRSFSSFPAAPIVTSTPRHHRRSRRRRHAPPVALRIDLLRRLLPVVVVVLLLLSCRVEVCLAGRRRGGGGGGGDGSSFRQAVSLTSSRSQHSATGSATSKPSASSSSSSSSSSSHHRDRDEPLLKSFLRAKCGPTGAAVWAYQGRLVDPLNGLTIANVQGVELVRCLAVTDPTGAQRERFRRRTGDLAIAPTLASAAMSPNLEYAGTLLSRKLFCYTSPDNSHQLLRRVRLRPTSPERNIPPNQAATVYDTATTYCQVSTPAKAGQSSTSSSNTLWALHTEYSDGRALWSTTQVQDDDLQKLVDFTVYARPLPLWRQRVDWKRWLGPAAAANEETSASGAVVSPRRSALVQLGGSNSGDAVGKFGARETYQYSTAFGRCQCRYSRYGEGPAWYGPGRICTLELQGRRVESWSELPVHIAQLVHERVVGFLSVNAPVPQDDALASRAVQVFRGKGAARLQIAPVDRDGSGGRSSGPLGGAFHRGWSAALSAWDRVRSATTVTLGGGSNGGGDGGDQYRGSDSRRGDARGAGGRRR